MVLQFLLVMILLKAGNIFLKLRGGLEPQLRIMI